MTAHYTLVRYLPDPVAEESINVGVIAWDENCVHSRFLSDWKRAQAFGGENIGFLKEFVVEVGELTSGQSKLPGLGDQGQLDGETLGKMIKSWHHCIQFAEPRGSLKGAEALLEDVAPIFLRETPSSTHKRARDRRVAAKKAADSLFSAIQNLDLPMPEQYVRKDLSISGKLTEHIFDLGLVNGRIYSAVRAISFEMQEDNLRRDLFATYFHIDDVRAEHENMDLTVVALQPRNQPQKDLFNSAKDILSKLNTEIVIEGQLRQWAHEKVKALPH